MEITADPMKPFRYLSIEKNVPNGDANSLREGCC
jgi:hypothetical protein